MSNISLVEDGLELVVHKFSLHLIALGVFGQAVSAKLCPIVQNCH